MKTRSIPRAHVADVNVDALCGVFVVESITLISYEIDNHVLLVRSEFTCLMTLLVCLQDL